ncbi:hypothetical protein LEP1GSC034_0551 [Leptospira interrogans str. 2003000735]|uniref:Uncharacterized protein n=5 Tax=Leptospira interrogans TaxID=173 RepID=M7A0L9_LEPIR|nr:hypothetical protein LEP1GSC007_3043 [Leptospira interrogans serovar Bulgarica str. Mallika]EKN87115.1 hypothetical protein LEP1GSC027_1003 [Leptospira interrogans str. 2002000624]EKO08240.1 hypothetical protein LEP1GSC077_1354 [Leptospira interrogans str. C10069]EKO97180.1 hypothetical protein LEP1GSC057_1665 [Leptospira interrogans str. Brem 329]EKP23276.1 hypothetical protein LEP1GSC117_2934 [Leptospira interrogans serovar Icterohaemorrhagiae str. Verdun LP]EKP75605.1 hypothetical protei
MEKIPVKITPKIITTIEISINVKPFRLNLASLKFIQNS